MNAPSDDFLKPISPIGREDSEKIFIPPIEADKRSNEDGSGVDELPPEEIMERFNAAITVLYKKVFELIPEPEKADITKQPEQTKEADPIRDIFDIFYKLLSQLKDRDVSSNNEFCSQLSEAWKKLLQGIEMSKRGVISSKCPIDKVEAFFYEIYHYPKDSEHKLGFYLSESAGKTWMPFPFLEILKNLHKEYVREANESQLQKWLDILSKFVI